MGQSGQYQSGASGSQSGQSDSQSMTGQGSQSDSRSSTGGQSGSSDSAATSGQSGQSDSGSAATMSTETQGSMAQTSQNDTATSARVKAAIAQVPNAPANDVQVQAYNGIVQLSGFVGSQRENDAALNAAKRTPGVRMVINSIQLKSDLTSDTQQQQR